VSTHSRLGKDPLAEKAAQASSAGREALRHILDLGSEPEAQTPAPALPDRSDLYREVAGRFSEAMDSLSRMAASAGVWAWGERAGDGDPLLFMRLLASYGTGPQGEGVDLAAFLHDVHDHWERHDIRIALSFADVFIPMERAFNLARAIQACLDGLCGRPGHAPHPLTMAARVDASGRIRLRLYGPARYFPASAPALASREAEPLTELARSGAVSLLFTRLKEIAELAVIA
jgi:hypothetical protein